MVEKNRYYPATKLLLPFLILVLIFSGACTPAEEKAREKEMEKIAEKPVEVPSDPVTFKTISGTWELKYPNHYGYTFRFYKNYRSIVILYLNNHSLIFKGVYTFERDRMVRINIYEMKKSRRVTGINLYSGFMKAKSSHFLFSVHLKEKKKRKVLSVSPRNITIDGKNSDGYFEPVIKLKRRGR